MLVYNLMYVNPVWPKEGQPFIPQWRVKFLTGRKSWALSLPLSATNCGYSAGRSVNSQNAGTEGGDLSIGGRIPRALLQELGVWSLVFRALWLYPVLLEIV